MNFDTWQCPKCGYLVTDVHLQSARFDYGCSRCKTPYGEFIARPAATRQEIIIDASDSTLPTLLAKLRQIVNLFDSNDNDTEG